MNRLFWTVLFTTFTLAQQVGAAPLCRWVHAAPTMISEAFLLLDSNPSARAERIVQQIFHRPSTDPLIKERRLARLAGKLYGELYSQPGFIKRSVGLMTGQRTLTQNQAERLSFEVSQLAFSKGIVETMKQMGLVRTPGLQQNLFDFISRHQNRIRTALASSLALATSLTHQLPIYLPEYRFLKTTLESHPELLDRVFLEGFQTHRAEVERVLRRPLRTEFGLNLVFRSVSTLVLFSVAHQVYVEVQNSKEAAGQNLLSSLEQFAKPATASDMAILAWRSEIEHLRSKGLDIDENSAESQARLKMWTEAYESTN